MAGSTQTPNAELESLLVGLARQNYDFQTENRALRLVCSRAIERVPERELTYFASDALESLQVLISHDDKTDDMIVRVYQLVAALKGNAVSEKPLTAADNPT